MADINDFIDPKLLSSLIAINEQLVKSGQIIDQQVVPAIKKLEEEQRKLGKNNDDNSKKRKQLTTDQKEAAKIAKQLETTQSKLLSLQNKQQDALIKTKTELQKTTKATKELQRAQVAQRGSTEQLSAVNAILEKRLKNVNQTTAKGKKQADLLRSAIDKNNVKIKTQSSLLTKQKINIGNYGNSMQGAAGKATAFAGATGIASSQMMLLGRITAGYTLLTKKKTEAEIAGAAATGLGTKALRILKIALLSTGIGALLVAFGSLVAFFKASEEGAASLQRIMSPFKILFGNIKDLAIGFGEAIANAFENPKEAVAGLWEAIKTNIVNRITGLIDTFKFFGKTIQAAFDLDFDAVKENAAAAGESMVQTLTGVDDAIGKATRGIKNFAEETAKENDQNKQLVNERLALIKREREANVELANLEVEIQKNRLKLKDEENLTNAERLVFAEKAQDQIRQQAAIEDELATKRLQFRILENSFSTSSQEDLDAEAQLRVALINVEAAGVKKLLRIESEKQTILKKINTDRAADVKGLSEQIIVTKQEEADTEVELEIDKLNRITEARAASAEEQQAIDDTDRQTKEQQAEESRKVAIQGATLLGNTLFNLKNAGLQREFDAAQGNAAKQAEISKKIAQNEKKQALFNIAIGTATGVVTALASLPPNVPLSIAIGIIGAIQSAAVLATPIPAFAGGVTNFGGGVAELAEQGAEMVKERSGKVWLAENRGLYNLQQGSTVLTAPQTQKELNDKRIVDELKLTRKAIQRQPRQRTESQFDKRQRGMKDGYHMMKNRMGVN